MTSKLAWFIGIVTVLLVAVGTLWPSKTAPTLGEASGAIAVEGSSKDPQGAVNKLLDAIEKRDWESAHSQLANASEIDKDTFARDLSGSYGDLRTYSFLQSFD